MVNKGTADGYLEVAKYELQARKISNRMDEIMAVIIQDNAYREQAQFQTYPGHSINPINQIITSPAEAHKIVAAAQKEADNIMTKAFSSGTQPPIATADAATTQATYSALPTIPPPTTPPVTAMTIAANHLDCGKLRRPASPSFTMNTIIESHPGAPANLLLTINMGNEGSANCFITPNHGNQPPKLLGQPKHHCFQRSCN